MAIKQKIYEVDNGVTIIYQKQPKGTNTSAIIGFSAGSRLDGKYKGLSHLIEHLFFRGETEEHSRKLIEKYTDSEIFTNAFTSENFVCHSLSTTDEKLEEAFDTFINAITRRRIRPEEIKQEIQIVKHEIDMKKDEHEDPSALELLGGSFLDEDSKAKKIYKDEDILGNPKTLSQITPEIINEYTRRYFNLNNLIISISTSKSIDEVLDILNKTAFTKLKPAKSKKFIVDLPEPKKYSTQNSLMVSPNQPSHNVKIDLILRVRNDYSNNQEKEIAYGLVEDICLNGEGFGGLLDDKFRLENPLVYSAVKHDINLGTAAYKHFYVLTNAAKFRKAIKVLCDTIYDLGVNGYTAKQFEKAKQKVIDLLKDDQKDKSGFAGNNFFHYVNGKPFIDRDLVVKYIKEMTLDEFNEFITKIYREANVSMAVEGEFDTRKMYRLVELEQMLGKMSHSEELWDYNAPYVEHTIDPDKKIESLTQNMQEIIQQITIGSPKEPKDTVTMNDELIK